MYDSGQPSQILPPGRKAPDFTLPSSDDRNISLHGYQGNPVVLAFYPADWSPVCTDQLALYNQILPEFQKFHAHLLGISVDSVWSHKAFAKARNLHFPLLADFEPKGAVTKVYGAYMYREGMAARALFVINPQGIIHWSYLSPIMVNPGADGILEALETMKEREPA
jgi:peroxiredoxin